MQPLQMKLLLSYNASVRRSPKRRAYSVTTSECDRFGVVIPFSSDLPN